MTKSTIMSMHMNTEIHITTENMSMNMPTIMSTAMALAKTKKKRRILMLRVPICTFSEIC